jgi:hypothetical protein
VLLSARVQAGELGVIGRHRVLRKQPIEFARWAIFLRMEWAKFKEASLGLAHESD